MKFKEEEPEQKPEEDGFEHPPSLPEPRGNPQMEDDNTDNPYD